MIILFLNLLQRVTNREWEREITCSNCKGNNLYPRERERDRNYGPKEIISILPMTVIMNITQLPLFQTFNGLNNNKDELLTTFTVYILYIIESLIIWIQNPKHHSDTMYGHL